MSKNCAFLSVIFNKKTDEQILCLIQTISKNYISYFNINELKTTDKPLFFAMVEKWWKNSPEMPITLYYNDEFGRFNYAKHHMQNNDYDVISGFSGINLKNLSEKRIKRKVVHTE